MNKETVCAVVVTYNRKELLIECFEALFKQTRPLEAIYIIDNASTDGTPELLKEKGFIQELPPENLSESWEKEFKRDNLLIYYVRMHENTGGAGGFYEGVKRAYERGYDWLWLMDDDTIAYYNALEKLLIKSTINNKIGYLCSKVFWIDKTPHLMNIPNINSIINDYPFNLYEEENVLLCSTASFVSLLIRKDIIKKIGFPLKEFFIWGDDVEYTLRMTKNNLLGAYVNNSIVIHKTKVNYSANDCYDWRFYYNIRNNLWIIKLHYGKKRYVVSLMKNLVFTFKHPIRYWFINIKACVDSLLSTPKKRL